MAKGRKRKKRSALYAPLSFILICAALVFGMSVFFRVSTVTVTGNSIYTEEEIIEASGIEQGDNLFFINRFSAVSRIFSKLPYVEAATISRSLPNNIVIEITESAALAYVTAEDGEKWAIDRSCKILANVDAAAAQSLIEVTGVTPISPSVGGIVSPGEAETPKVTYLSEILKMAVLLEIERDITYIDMSNVSNPQFDYLGRFTVKLGSNENVDYKFQLLVSAVAELGEGDSGTLDLSIDKRAHLTYD